jgi:AraC-like DNA-binding protein
MGGGVQLILSHCLAKTRVCHGFAGKHRQYFTSAFRERASPVRNRRLEQSSNQQFPGTFGLFQVMGRPMQECARIVDQSTFVDAGGLLKCAVDIDTSMAPSSEQFDLYRGWHSNIVDVTLLREKFKSFAARERVWQLGDLVLASIEYPGTGYRRRWSNKKNPIFDHWLLVIPQTIPSNGGPARSGQLRWQCLAEASEGQGEDDGVIALFLPRDFAFTQAFSLEIRPAMAGFIVDYLLLLYHSLPNTTEKDVPHIAEATTSLLRACISPSQMHLSEAQAPIDAVILGRAKRLIATALADRNLTPEKLCHELGVSRSRLYRIFEANEGISNYIRRQRLLKTKEALADCTNVRPISSIAEEWGFVDPSTYSRTFKKEFGISPKEAREASWMGVKFLPSIQRTHESGPSAPSLNDLLSDGYTRHRQS